MAQALAVTTAHEPNSVDKMGLCLLSLDGGGVRGLSSLYILKGIMAQLNHARRVVNLPAVKPCEVFDLIGGTSTGGLIAVMLGRLEMDVDECILAYVKLMKTVFEEKSNRFPISLTGRIKPRFDSSRLKDAIVEVITHHGACDSDLFNDGKARGCRVFVCATAKETTGITRLRSYSLPEEFDISATICEAALATSAATSFFDPVFIGARVFEDGALGANNPVDEVEGEASNIWCSESGNLKPLVKCFISIGTGNPGKNATEDNIFKFFSNTLVAIATETEQTERKFIARWAKHFDEKRYFRFNVEQGLQGVGLAEYQEQGRIEAATQEYLGHQSQKSQVRNCVQNLRQKQSRTEISFATIMNEYEIHSGMKMKPISDDTFGHASRQVKTQIFNGDVFYGPINYYAAKDIDLFQKIIERGGAAIDRSEEEIRKSRQRRMNHSLRINYIRLETKNSLNSVLKLLDKLFPIASLIVTAFWKYMEILFQASGSLDEIVQEKDNSIEALLQSLEEVEAVRGVIVSETERLGTELGEQRSLMKIRVANEVVEDDQISGVQTREAANDLELFIHQIGKVMPYMNDPELDQDDSEGYQLPSGSFIRQTGNTDARSDEISTQSTLRVTDIQETERNRPCDDIHCRRRRVAEQEEQVKKLAKLPKTQEELESEIQAQRDAREVANKEKKEINQKIERAKQEEESYRKKWWCVIL